MISGAGAAKENVGPGFPEPVPVRPSIARWPVQHATAADFGRAVRLAGYAAPASAAPGGALALDLYWEVLGPTLEHAEPGAADENEFWNETYLYSRAATVYGGTQQIQRNIIADRVLALPQE